MEKELVKKILKTTNFTSTEIYKLIDIYKDTTMVNTNNFKKKFVFFVVMELQVKDVVFVHTIHVIER